MSVPTSRQAPGQTGRAHLLDEEPMPGTAVEPGARAERSPDQEERRSPPPDVTEPALPAPPVSRDRELGARLTSTAGQSRVSRPLDREEPEGAARGSARAALRGDELGEAELTAEPPGRPHQRASTAEPRHTTPQSLQGPDPGPQVHIGRVDVVVAAPPSPQPASTPASNNLASRSYLRSL